MAYTMALFTNQGTCSSQRRLLMNVDYVLMGANCIQQKGQIRHLIF